MPFRSNSRRLSSNNWIDSESDTVSATNGLEAAKAAGKADIKSAGGGAGACL